MGIFFICLLLGFNYYAATQVAIISSGIIDVLIFCICVYMMFNRDFHYKYLLSSIFCLVEAYSLFMIWTVINEPEQVPMLGLFGLIELITSNAIIHLARIK